MTAPGGRWRATLQHHGRDFVGWQVQPEGRSVQAVLEAALEAFCGAAVTAHASGRTDAGVHALGQVVHFDLPVRRSAASVRDGLNAHLPDDVAVIDAAPVPADFDARRWVLRKRYRYAWLDRRARSPLLADRAWHLGRALDVDAMTAAAAALVGRHDFSAFRAAGCGAAHAERLIQDVAVAREGELVVLDVVGNGFLRHMVRIVAGTLTDVGLGRRPPGWVAEVLAGRDRALAGKTAPAHGLTLVEVTYGDGPNPGR